MKIGEKLPILRKRCGLSQEDLANELDVSRQSVYKWENGDAKPEIDKLQKIAKVLGVSFDYLLDENIDITKVEDIPKDIIANDNYREVFVTEKDLMPREINITVLPTIENSNLRLDDKDLKDVEELKQNPVETKKAMNEYFAQKGYTNIVELQNHEDKAFFVDNKNSTFGIYYEGRERFVCPIENLMDISIEREGGDLSVSSKPKVGLLVGGLFGVGVGKEDSLDVMPFTGYKVTISYFDGNGSPKDFGFWLDSNVELNFKEAGKMDPEEYSAMKQMQDKVYLDNVVKELKLQIKALTLTAQKIKSGKIAVKEMDYTEQKAKFEEYKNELKALVEKLTEEKKATKKKNTICLIIVAGLLLLVFGIGLLIQ